MTSSVAACLFAITAGRIYAGGVVADLVAAAVLRLSFPRGDPARMGVDACSGRGIGVEAGLWSTGEGPAPGCPCGQSPNPAHAADRLEVVGLRRGAPSHARVKEVGLSGRRA